jgi:hypothetical protein
MESSIDDFFETIDDLKQFFFRNSAELVAQPFD